MNLLQKYPFFRFDNPWQWFATTIGLVFLFLCSSSSFVLKQKNQKFKAVTKKLKNNCVPLKSSNSH